MKDNLRHWAISFLPYSLLLLIFSNLTCSSLLGTNNKGGELIGIQGRNKESGFYMPLGMVLVPGGNFVMGLASESINGSVVNNRRVSISSFFMDSTPITNNQYRQFINDLLDIAANLPQGAQVSSDTNQAPVESTVVERDVTNNFSDAGANNDLNSSSADQDTTSFTTEYIMEHLYPKASVWKTGGMQHMSDPMVENYYESSYFDDYPVVGITWDAAREFCNWRTKLLNDSREKRGLPLLPSFRLCTAAEFEYAARGGHHLSKYPWGGPYVRDEKGKVLANFKVESGNYAECGYTYTSPVKTFLPNNFGLYDMCGNVSHWCLDSYSVASEMSWDINPIYYSEDEPKKVIKGGSWKDIAYLLQSGVVDYAHKDVPTAYIGFRCVMPYFGYFKS
jgi:sulfatase modifying factor 1